jgi:hypothetical protein
MKAGSFIRQDHGLFGVMAYVPVSGRYWTYPAAAWAASHSRT